MTESNWLLESCGGGCRVILVDARYSFGRVSDHAVAKTTIDSITPSTSHFFAHTRRTYSMTSISGSGSSAQAEPYGFNGVGCAGPRGEVIW